MAVGFMRRELRLAEERPAAAGRVQRDDVAAASSSSSDRSGTSPARAKGSWATTVSPTARPRAATARPIRPSPTIPRVASAKRSGTPAAA